jgi:uncharacterized pyridoxamine 5'-phosphate oxidase family protein
MHDIVMFLEMNFNGFLATLEEGRPRVRPYQFIMEDGGRLCFSTNTTKEVCKQLKANPAMEFSASNAQGGWIRLSGDVKFTDDGEVKTKILAKSEVVRTIYKTIEHPAFTVFYLDQGIAQIMATPGAAIVRTEF